MEDIKKGFYFMNLKNELVLKRKLECLFQEGWRVLDTEPIGETSIKLFCSKSSDIQ